MKILAILALALVAISFTGCSSMTPAERTAFDNAAPRAAADAEQIGLSEYARRSK